MKLYLFDKTGTDVFRLHKKKNDRIIFVLHAFFSRKTLKIDIKDLMYGNFVFSFYFWWD